MRSLFPLVVLKCVFMLKSNSLVNPKDLFFCGVDQKGTGGAEIYILMAWRNQAVRVVGAS